MSSDNAPDQPNLRQMVYAESEIGAYNNLESSMKTEDFNLYDNQSVTDTADSHSVVSYATSIYSETMDPTHKKKKSNNYQINQNYVNGAIKQFHPQTNKKLSSTASKTSIDLDRMESGDSFAKQMYLDTQRNHKTTPYQRPINDYGGGLAKKLKTHHKIRESMELDLNASMQSRGSTGQPSARMSEIAKQSVLTLRMISVNPKKQIRLKLYLPITNNEQDKPQIIVLFVNRGSTMGICKQFVEDNYPHKVLQGKIRQLCIADDDGDIDEDFPPINDNQDITSLGIQNFWVDRLFDDKRKPSVIYSEKEMVITSKNGKDRHRDTMKERLVLINQDKEDIDIDNDNDDDDESEYQQQPPRCCWCCFGSKQVYDDDDDNDEQSIESGKSANNYHLMSPNSNSSSLSMQQHRKSNVQYASL